MPTTVDENIARFWNIPQVDFTIFLCFHTLTFHTTTLICDTLNVEHADRRTKLRRIYMFTVLVVLVVYQFCRFSDDIPIGHLNETCEDGILMFFEVSNGEVILG